MAITTYAELQAAAAAWLVRGDLTARILEFISLAEARLNRIVRPRTAEIEATLTGTPSSRTINLPAAFAEPLALWIVTNGERCDLEFLEPSTFDATASLGRPYIWTVDGAKLAFERPLDQAYSFVLRYKGGFALSDAAPTNDLLTRAPDAYLFATLCEAAPFLRDADLLNAYETKLSTAVRDFNAQEARSKAPAMLTTEAGALQRLSRRAGYNIATDRG